MTAVVTTEQGLEIERLAGNLGAVITNVDIRDVDDATFEAVRDALTEHMVICLRGQAEATPDDHIAFGRRWGKIEPHPYVPPVEGYPEIMEVYDPNAITTTWHADFTYASAPPGVSLLLARIIPVDGSGDTMFSNAYLAFENLSPGLQKTLLGMRAVHHATQMALDSGFNKEETTNAHPVARVHPITGRRAIFVNDNYVDNFEGWTADESKPLLGYLYSQVGRLEYSYRHHWQPGDLLIWDNRCVQHAVIGDTHGQKRSLHRVTIAGEAPV